MRDKWIEKFEKEALPVIILETKPINVFIFGSRIKGCAREDSDIDVIIVSDFFKTIPFVMRAGYMLKKLRFSKHLDIICYSSEEFKRACNDSLIIQDAHTYWHVAA